MIEACFFGHVTFDDLGDSIQPGGSSLFGSSLAAVLGLDCSVITTAASDFIVSDRPNLHWFVQPSSHTTRFFHHYTNDLRETRLLKRADKIQKSWVEIAPEYDGLVMLCPVLDEVTPDFVSLFSTQWIALTPQGWFRSFDAKGKMLQIVSRFHDLPKKIKLIVVSQDDIAKDVQAWKWICKFAEVAVCTKGKEGYILCVGGNEKSYSPLQVMEEKNPTGCGDLFSTALLILLSKGFVPAEACRLAGHAAALASTQDNFHESIKNAADFLQSKF